MNTLVHCKVDNRWMWGLENACLTIYSPTGGYVRIEKKYMSEEFSDELRSLIWRIEGNGNTIRLTKDEMMLLTTYPKASIYKPKPKGLSERKTDWKKRNPNAGKQCGCGGSIIEKDHGKWIGWYCPKCKSGGSKNKK